MTKMTFDEFVVEMLANFDRQDVDRPERSTMFLDQLRRGAPDTHAELVDHFRAMLLNPDLCYMEIGWQLVGDRFTSEENALSYLRRVWGVVIPDEPFPER